jgi:hypothetical protein
LYLPAARQPALLRPRSITVPCLRPWPPLSAVGRGTAQPPKPNPHYNPLLQEVTAAAAGTTRAQRPR